MISDNLQKVRQEIQNSCALVSRNSNEVTLVGVTKSVDSDKMKELYDSGLNVFAENRVDVLLKKQAELIDYPKIEWHFIGHLQRRKVKEVINRIDYFHALESLKLAAEIQKRADHIIRCFVQVNVSGEESKHGMSPEEVIPFIKEMEKFEHIEIVGLMTMAPLTEDKEKLRQYFKQLRLLKDKVQSLNLSYAPCTELSMGMSNDFNEAIIEGASYVRIGTKLVGE